MDTKPRGATPVSRAPKRDLLTHLNNDHPQLGEWKAKATLTELRIGHRLTHIHFKEKTGEGPEHEFLQKVDAWEWGWQ
jgi:hypothetical protein